jgi:hypothetical protein
MKILVIYLILVLSTTVSAETSIPTEPELLKELFAQAGALEVEGSWVQGAKLSDLLGEALSYSFDDEIITVEHLCNFNKKSWDCNLSILKRTFGVDGEGSDESLTTIRYNATYDNKTGDVTIISVRFDKLGH